MAIVRSTFNKLAGLVRFAVRARRLIDDRITLDQAADAIRAGVEQREKRFLAMLTRAIVSNPRSPYRRLMSCAGCEPGDIAGLVEREGLEGALATLAQAGVHVTYDEFKGRSPAIRGSQTFRFQPDDFDDPLARRFFAASTGGTRGAPTRVPIDAALISEMTPYWMMFLAEHGCVDAPLVFWAPGHAGVAARYLSCARGGRIYAEWFVSAGMRSLKDRVYSAGIHWLARRAGPFPRPRRASFSEPQPVLDHLRAELAAGRTPCVNTTPSAAVKLSAVAQTRGVPLAGITFLLGSEPLTPARRRAIEASGARAAPLYGSTEAPWIGGQCRHARTPDEVHVFADSYAIVPIGETMRLTSLRYALPKVLLNVDIGDRATLETGRCGCSYDRLGCRLRLHTIRSADKITEFGVTFALHDVFHVLEDLLPARLGGSAGDYQLVEERDGRGLARYTILLNPALPPIDDARVPDAFLSEIARLRDYYGVMASIWQRERLVGVQRGPAIAGASGKILPFARR